MQRLALIIACLLAGCSPRQAPTGGLADGNNVHAPAHPREIVGVRNFAQISPALYRGEQPTADGFAELKRRGIKTIVDLRTLHDDRELLSGTGFQYFHIYAKPWHAEDEDVVTFLKIVEAPENQPVFVHCQHGADRTGYVVAVYRIVEQGWSAEDAVAEMRTFAFHPVWVDIPMYLNRVNVKLIRAAVAEAKQPDLTIVR
jgi:protein tyrosine phosphatase (PTP) superfamily phosphohydrolase (DUF442 family)